MGAAPGWKVYDAQGEYQAATKRPEEAGAVVALLGEGATIRSGHGHVVWTEGKEEQPAAESFDLVAETCYRRAAEPRQVDPVRQAAAQRAAYTRRINRNALIVRMARGGQ